MQNYSYDSTFKSQQSYSYSTILYKKGSYLDAFLLGFFIYAVYETTNMAIFKDWSYKVGLIDLTWGGFLFLITTYLYKNSVKYI